jgi:hypothetical protein
LRAIGGRLLNPLQLFVDGLPLRFVHRALLY